MDNAILIGKNISRFEKFVKITNIAIPNIDGERYIISISGKVYDKYEENFLKEYECATSSSGKSYLSVNLKLINGIRSYFLHRLVFHCFYPYINIDGLDINHEDGNKYNNCIWNLKPCTRRYNIQHAYATGLMQVGEDSHLAKISEETAKHIIDLLINTNYTSKEICNIVKNGATTAIVDSIRKKESWTHLSKNYTFNQRVNRLFEEQDIHNFCRSFQNNKRFGYGINDNCRLALIENGFEVTDRYVETLRKIYTKKYYKNIVSQYNW